jgi:RNA polymerase sigma factor (sigma-70 family)
MRPQKGRKMKNIINENTVNGSSNTITENTTLAELISILGPVTRAAKTPTSRKLREEAGEPIAESDGILVYSNGYAVYDNGSGRTVVWVPACTSFTYYFDKMKESEKGGEIKETFELPEGLLESQPWPIAVTLIGDHRVEQNSMNRMGSRTGTRDYDSDDNGDKDGDAENAIEKSYQNEYNWREDRVGEDPETIYIRKETRREMLESMTEKQRKVFILYYQYGYTQQEIADMLDCVVSTVNKHLERAVDRIKSKKFF